MEVWSVGVGVWVCEGVGLWRCESVGVEVWVCVGEGEGLYVWTPL